MTDIVAQPSSTVATPAYERLVGRFRRLSRLAHFSQLGAWDQEVLMPAGGMDGRAQATAELAVLQREILIDPSAASDLTAAGDEALSQSQAANLDEMRRAHRRAAAIPSALIEAQSLASARCERAWRRQRPDNDWAGFRENLREMVALARQEADARRRPEDAERYDALIDGYEPGMTAAALESILMPLADWLPDLVARVTARQGDVAPAYGNSDRFPVAGQKALSEDVMAALGFDFEHGRLDLSTHPFSCGTPDDARITTRFFEDDPLNGLMSTIHETGHACYEQNRPREWMDQPAGLARSAGVHESQSLSFEMQLARSRGFIAQLAPRLAEHFPGTEIDAEALVAHVQRVKPGRIRVDADEVCYPLHILLRFEIERALINGTIEVDDIPEHWDRGMARYFGIDTRGDFRNGCMQDIHWSLGLFGYFPSYALGALLASQLMAALRVARPTIDAEIESGDFHAFFDFLRERIWSQGSLHSTPALIVSATGTALDPAHFRRHVERRYLGVVA